MFSNATSIETIAHSLNISHSSVHNWIKTNLLETIEIDNKIYVKTSSFLDFCHNHLGKNKLNKYANKSLKDTHNHKELTLKYLKKLENGSLLENLGSYYEEELSNATRNLEGIYYTPNTIVEQLFTLPEGFDVSKATFCDPCCGSGNFIMHALKLGFKVENIYGYDTDAFAIALTKQRIKERYHLDCPNILQKDFLHLEHTPQFDCIFTNPPWGKKYPKNQKEIFKRRFNLSQSLDSASLFFMAGLNCLKENAHLGLLLPESCLNIDVFSEMREIALTFQIKKLIDFNKPFKTLMTRAVGLVLKKAHNNAPNNDEKISCFYQNNEFERSPYSFFNNPKKIFNIHCSSKENEVLDHLFSIPHITLKDNAHFALGIVTGNNKEKLYSKQEKNTIAIFSGSDILKDSLKPPSKFINTDLSKCQQVAPLSLYKAREKIVYKFISSKLVFFCDTKQRLFLNSANMFVLKENFPIQSYALKELLNSDLMQFIFEKLFRTHKILRKDLECLPLFTQFINDTFDEKTYLKCLGIKKLDSKHFAIKQ
ncbi:type II adenine specific methyltransferase [Helicobacter cetorum MIT 00-7128]|uniref:site-specific DNA-methyltransferase (adenine-specific) n=1 Tax=Helicobacter cetorum (strain ATCC BAA-429 / MIT 00-7128) TaxID=182217 RepID=I0ENF4_HELC0|nr:type II adenine specific methyltransferase [Helicobacter cetorum MIT 00-7128]